MPPLTRLHHVILIGSFIAGLTIRLWIAWQPWERLVSTGAFGDDACYYGSIAWHIAHGYGPTADGVHPTNGFQPLWAFMLVPIYALGIDKGIAINCALTLLAIFSAATALILFAIARHLWSVPTGLWVAFFWSFSPTVLRQSMNGMETGLYAFMLSLATWYYIRYVVIATAKDNRDERVSAYPIRYAIMGGLIGLTVLSRIDGLLFAFALLATHVIREAFMSTKHRGERRPSSPHQSSHQNAPITSMMPEWYACSKRMNGLRSICNILLASWVFVMLLLPWLVYSLHTTGKLMPESGPAVRFLSLAYKGMADGGVDSALMRYSILEGIATIMRLRQWHFAWSRISGLLTPIGAMILLLGISTILMIAIHQLWRAGWREHLLWVICGLRHLSFLFAFAIMLFCAYTLYQFGWWFFPRYFFSLTPLGTLIGAALVESIRRALMHSSRCARECDTPSAGYDKSIIAYCWAGSVVIFQIAMCIIGWVYLRANVFGGFEEYLRVAYWLRENTPVDARIGMFQSGVASYLSERTVINLDGVVNGSALNALRQRRMLRYVASQGIKYVGDWEGLLRILLLGRSSDEGRKKWRLVCIRKGEISIYRLELRHPTDAERSAHGATHRTGNR